ncbi:FAD-dependent oxidoreductase [Amphibacillus indicireducens]|uniref:FAD-dependent oxidoreductase n=1 Tax=Amphibacillus indicireducens TaxID=1076330 RepID=A0ABP7W4N4_9BACI
MINQDKTNKSLPDVSESYWLNSVSMRSFPKLNKDINVDVVIVGGGITGVTTAYLLAKSGLKIALLESDKLLNGTTGHTTAKITAQHGLIYHQLIKDIGIEQAMLYYQANFEALNFIRETIAHFEIDCEYSQQDAWVYAVTKKDQEKVEQEAKAYNQLGIKGTLVDSIPLDLAVNNALIMKDQAQFHPLKYLEQLVEQVTEMGGKIFEETTAVDIKKGQQPVVLTRDQAKVTANHVIVCSHFPFYEGLGLYSAKMYAERSYAIVAKVNKQIPAGLFISAANPTRSLRKIAINGEEMALIVGENHKTGQGIDTIKHYHALESFGQTILGIDSIKYRWSAQDLTTLDQIPYIGRITSGNPNVLIATGYRKWGITNGTAATLLITDLVNGKKNKYEELFKPARFNPIPSLKNLVVQNANVVEHLVKGKLQLSQIDPKTLSSDQGAIISIDGKRKGAYKDDQGKLHLIDTTCTHLGCEVEWNSGERTWDCPCHGSRFSYTGDVVEGPAEKPLKKYDYNLHYS